MFGYAFKPFLQAIKDNQCTKVLVLGVGGSVGRQREAVKPLATWEGHTGRVKSVTALPDGSVVSGSGDKTLRRWDLSTGQCLGTWTGHTDDVKSVTVLPDGTVVSGSGDKTLRHWDLSTGQCLGTWEGHTGHVEAVAVLPDGSVVSGSRDKTLRHWDLSTGQCLSTWEGPRGGRPVLAVTVLPDGTVVSGGRDESLWRWDLSTEQYLGTWEGHRGPVWAVTALPDGSVVSGGHDETLRRWEDVSTAGRCLGIWKGHRGPVLAVTALPDGTVVSGSWDKTLRRWDPTTGQCLGIWEGHTAAVLAVTVLPDGSVVSGSADNTLRHWPPVGPALTETQFSEVLRALTTNTCVHTLSVKDGIFSNAAVESLLHILKTHPTLHTLVLENCGMGDEVLEKVLVSIEAGVREHHTLPKTVSFEGNLGLGSVNNQYALAQAYFTGGRGLVKNVEESARWFMEPAQQGYVEAQYRLGVCYTEGQGVTQNIKKAHEWFMKAAEQGYVMAYWHLGLLFSTGTGVALSNDTAQAWFTKARTQALPNINELLAFAGEKSLFRQEQGLTVYHLMALMGDRRWYEALATLSFEEKKAYGLEEATVLAKDRQGLIASELASQQLIFLAEDKGLTVFSAEAQGNRVLQGYSHCVKQLRQGEEEVKLAQFLRAQQGQARSRLNYSERLAALLKEIDALRGTKQCAVVGEALEHAYSALLQPLWRGKGALINLYEKLNKKAPWPSDFDPYGLLSPSQAIAQWTREGVSVPIGLKLSAKLKGPIAYVMYEEEQLRGYCKAYMDSLKEESEAGLGKASFYPVIRAYRAYIQLWNSVEKTKDKAQRAAQKAYLMTTPTLVLQSGCTPAFVDDRIPQGSTLSPAQKLSYFLNAGMKIEGMVGAGTAPVFPIQGVHYKRNPHAPGVEYMVSSLGNVLAGEGATPTVLLKVIGPDGIPYAYQASHTVQGKDLQSVILHHSDCIEKIRSDNFSAVAVLGMLTDPQDGKPDNYMVEFAVDPNNGTITQIDILGIDNDIAFADVVISKHVEGEKAGHHFINIKNVIYFFPQMMQPIDPGFRDTFLKREPEFIVMEWLRGLQEKNVAYELLLKEGVFTEEEYSGSHGNKRGLQLPIKVVPGTIRTLYRKLCQMNIILKDNPTITLWELLMAVEPEVGTHYAKVKAHHPHDRLGCDPMACITTLYEENIANGRELMWFRAQLDAGFTHTMTRVVLKTAEEFGFEDNRTATLASCLWKLLTVLQYERFTGVLAPVLYESLTELVKQFSPQTPLLDGLLSHGCYNALYWVWTEQLIAKSTIQSRCDTLKKYSLLHFWVEGKHDGGVKGLLKEKVYAIDVTNGQGYTPLHIAASVGDSVMVELLLNHGADKAATTTLGKTPLAMAESRAKQASNPSKYEGVIGILKDPNVNDEKHERRSSESSVKVVAKETKEEGGKEGSSLAMGPC